jgi:hypothetical protein
MKNMIKKAGALNDLDPLDSNDGLNELESSIDMNTQMGGKRKKRKTKSKKTQKGGYNSGWSYGVETLGTGWTQFMNSFSLGNNQNSGTIQTNDIEPVNNINANNPANSIFKYNSNGGNGRSRSRSKSPPRPPRSPRKSRSKGKGKKGGSITSILNQAVVPFSLLVGDLMVSKKKSRKIR